MSARAVAGLRKIAERRNFATLHFSSALHSPASRPSRSARLPSAPPPLTERVRAVGGSLAPSRVRTSAILNRRGETPATVLRASHCTIISRRLCRSHRRVRRTILDSADAFFQSMDPKRAVHITAFADHLLMYIFSFLDSGDLSRAALVGVKWRTYVFRGRCYL